jgi:hypothetical protein
MFATRAKRERATPRAVAASVGIHVVVGAVVLLLLSMPSPVSKFFRHPADANPPKVESITYVAGPQASAPRTPQRPAAAGQPVNAPAPPPLVAPVATPTTIPPAPTTKPRADVVPPIVGATTGPVGRIGGPAEGARTEYHDPRVWVAPNPDGGPARGTGATLDSIASRLVQAHNDSLGPPHKQPGDWTTNIGGNKWGIDQKFIHLGPVSIPTAVLAVLPLNVTANPIDNDRTVNAHGAEIQQQANRMLTEEQFNKMVKEERLRKQKEHDDAKQKQQQQQQPTPPPQPTTTPVAPIGNN